MRQSDFSQDFQVRGFRTSHSRGGEQSDQSVVRIRHSCGIGNLQFGVGRGVLHILEERFRMRTGYLLKLICIINARVENQRLKTADCSSRNVSDNDLATPISIITSNFTGECCLPYRALSHESRHSADSCPARKQGLRYIMGYSSFTNRRERLYSGKESTYELILASTIRLMGIYGLNNVTIGMIVHETKFTRPTLYNYFTSKDEMISCSIDRLLQPALEIFENQDMAFCQKILSISEVTSLPYFDPDAKNFENSSLDQFLTHLEHAISECQTEGSILPEYPAKQLMKMVIRVLTGEKTGIEAPIVKNLLGLQL